MISNLARQKRIARFEERIDSGTAIDGAPPVGSIMAFRHLIGTRIAPSKEIALPILSRNSFSAKRFYSWRPSTLLPARNIHSIPVPDEQAISPSHTPGIAFRPLIVDGLAFAHMKITKPNIISYTFNVDPLDARSR